MGSRLKLSEQIQEEINWYFSHIRGTLLQYSKPGTPLIVQALIWATAGPCYQAAENQPLGNHCIRRRAGAGGRHAASISLYFVSHKGAVIAPFFHGLTPFNLKRKDSNPAPHFSFQHLLGKSPEIDRGFAAEVHRAGGS